jgi:TRAP-type C4-dicarboxylate transport system substrate-binding protein
MSRKVTAALLIKPLRTAAVIVLVATITACTGGQPPAGDHTEAKAQPVTLRLGTPEEAGRPGYEIAQRFAATVRKDSDAAVTVNVTQAGIDEPAFDQASIDELINGQYDLALVPARAWHSRGITTLEALQLPTLVETDDQADRIAQSSAVPDMLAGLEPAGLTGLAIYPEGLRHFATFGDLGVLTSTNLNGKRVRAPRADTPWATIKALGGSPVEADGDDFETAVVTGRIQAAESSLALVSSLPDHPVMTADIAIYYKFQILAAQTAALKQLDPTIQQLLRKAAASTLSQTVADRPHERDGFLAACADQGNVGVTVASPDTRRKLRAMMRNVLKDARRDPFTARSIDAVSKAAGQADAPPLPKCKKQ